MVVVMKNVIVLLLAAAAMTKADLGVCEITKIGEEDPDVIVDPRYPPSQRGWCSASATGDPHITTFDSVKYDCMVGGEMILVESMDSDFEIQGRFETIHELKGHTEVYGYPSAMTGIAVREEGFPLLQMTASGEQRAKLLPGDNQVLCDTDFYLDGVKIPVQPGVHTYDGGIRVINQNMVQICEEEEISSNGLPRCIKYKSTSFYNNVMIFYPNNLRVYVRHTIWNPSGDGLADQVLNGSDGDELQGNCVFNVIVMMPCDYRADEHLIGLFGTMNGHQADDWMDVNGNTIPIPDDARVSDHAWQLHDQPAHDYCTRWFVPDHYQSLFTYEIGKDFYDFIDTEDYISNVESLLENASDDIKEACVDNIQCIIDALEFGKDAGLTELEFELAEIGDACPVTKIDFSTFNNGDIITTQLQEEYGLTIITDKGYGAVVTETEYGKGLVLPSDSAGEIQFMFDYSRHVMAMQLDTGNISPLIEVKNLANNSFLIQTENSPDAVLDVEIEYSAVKAIDVPLDADGAIFTLGYFACPCASHLVNQTVWFEDPSDDPDYKVPTSRSGGNLPPPTEPGNGGSFGDPHLKTWRGHLFDFHGECDLLLVHSDKFANGKGLDIHIRTEIRKDWSFISEAAVRIGSETLQMDKQGLYYLNGVKNAPMPSTIAGFSITHSYSKKGRLSLDIDLGQKSHIFLREYKEFVSVHVVLGREEDFGDSIGLMGEFSTGRMLQRDGKRVLEDPNVYAQEWQVRDTEIKLFRTERAPQFPQTCRLPDVSASSNLRRRLAAGVTYDEAARACKKFGDDESDIEGCIFDVMATGDLDMASGGSW